MWMCCSHLGKARRNEVAESPHTVQAEERVSAHAWWQAKRTAGKMDALVVVVACLVG